jgi:hypothetical protein
MRFAPLPGCRSAGLILTGMLAIGGCNRSPSPEAEKSPPVAGQPSAASALGTHMTSKVPVSGDEALPPNHPPLPSASPPHPIADAGKGSDVDARIAAQHPAPVGKKKLPVALPDGVQGKWASATLAVAAEGGEKELKLGIGETISLNGRLQLRLVHYLPAYSSDFQTVTSLSNEQLNPAVQVEALRNGEVVAEGWVFQRLPEFNSFKSEWITVRLISAERSQGK